MNKDTRVCFVIFCFVVALCFITLSAFIKVYGLEVRVGKLDTENQMMRSAFQALTKTNWLFKDARVAASGYYTVTVASLGADNLEIKTVDFTVPARAFSPYLRDMDRYGEPRALKGKSVVFHFPKGPPYGDHLVFNGLLEFSVVN